MKTTLTNERGEKLDITYAPTNVHIENSYTIAGKYISEWIKVIKTFGEQNGYVYARSEQSWINEWKAHNLLCKWGVKPNRTKDVDLNESETSLRKLGYFLLSKLYI